MKITSVTVGYSRLVTEGNFSNRRFSCELTAEVGEYDPLVVRDKLEKECLNYVESKIAGEEIIVVSKEKATRLREVVKAIHGVNETDLPF